MTNELHLHTRRFYSAHHVLLRIAEDNLFLAQDSDGKNHNALITTIVICSMAIEAIANAVGSKVISDWCDFENCSPTAKIRTICLILDIKEPLNNDLFYF